MIIIVWRKRKLPEK